MPRPKACPSSEMLLAHLDHRVEGALRGSVPAHLESGCPRCAAEIHMWERICIALTAEAAVEVPDSFRRRVLALFDERFPKRGEGAARWREWMAAVTFDSRTTPLPAGVREGGAEARIIEYAAAEIAIQFRWEQVDTAWQAHGWVVGAAEQGQQGVLHLRVGDTVTTANLTADGEFWVTGVPDGEIMCVIETAGTRVVLPVLELTS